MPCSVTTVVERARPVRWRASSAAQPLETTYFIRSDLFKTLLLYRAGSSALLTSREGGQLDGSASGRFQATGARGCLGQRARRLLANHRGGNGAAHQSDQELEAAFRREL